MSPRRAQHSGGPEILLGKGAFPAINERKPERHRVTAAEARANVQYYADAMDGIKPELNVTEDFTDSDPCILTRNLMSKGENIVN